MKHFKILTTVLLMFVVAAGMMFAAAQQEAGGERSAVLKDIGFHASGDPIADKQVEMNAIIGRWAHLPVPFEEMTLLIDLQKKTNVKVNFEEIPSVQLSEKVNLMFASRDFPDVFFRANVNDRLLWQAAEGGDVYPLNDLIDKYAPNWKKGLTESPDVKKSITLFDGKIYSLPYTREIENDYGIRDIESINVKWMEQLGLNMPKTTDEFYDVLKAFRNGIDNGQLPKEGVPYYMRFHSTIAGEFPVYGYFGIWIYSAGSTYGYLSVNNGKVEFGPIDPKLKNAIGYLHKLYKERLITEEMFTDEWATYLAKSRSVPPIIGAFGSYFIPEQVEEWFDPLPPQKAPGVDKPLFRSQRVRIEKNYFTIMKKYQYPEVAIRFIDHFADDLTSIQMTYGPIGVTIDDNKDGTYTARGVSAEYLKHCPANFIAQYISKGISEKIVWTRDQGRRAKYVAEIYRPYTWPQDRHYPRVLYTEEETEEMSILSSEIGGYVKKTFADWIVNGTIEAGWDEYLAQLDKLGLKKLMEINQAAYDRYQME